MAYPARNIAGALLAIVAVAGCGGAGAKGPGGVAGRGGVGGAGGMGGVAGTVGTGGLAGSVGGTDAIGGGAGSVGGAGGTAGGGGTGVGGGDGGMAGTAGAAGMAGAAGAAGAIDCTFTVTSALSTAIPTVGIVTFTTDLADMTRAEIRFGPASGGPTMTAPVDLTRPGYRTLLLGMKGSRAYVFRIMATAAVGSCTSPDYTLTTGAVPSSVPRPNPTIDPNAPHARGFILTEHSGISFILDADGEPVWWNQRSVAASRAHMSWDGNDVYFVGMSPGNVTRISMDGTSMETLSGLTRAHHDLTAIPGGIATLIEIPLTGGLVKSSVVERSTDGTITVVVDALSTLYDRSGHTNSIHYWPWDDSYTVGDSAPSAYVKITRKGELVWQLGGANPKDPSKFFALQGVTPWTVNHGHHLLADGTFAFMNNGLDPQPVVRVFALDETTMTATSLLAYRPSDARGLFLGDVQRLPSGNFLITYMESGQIREIDPSGQLVAQISLSFPLGYSEFRESLYGPPPY